jgi:hypothetical protein
MQEEDHLQFDDALTRLCDDALTPAQRDQLTKELRDSKLARESYIRYVSLNFWLRARFNRLKPHADSTTALRAIAATSLSAPRAKRRILWPALVAVAASVFFATAVWKFGWVGSRVEQTPKAYRPIAALVVATYECDWERNGAANRLGQVLRDGDVIDIRSGLAELRFDSGARLIVRGSTALEIASAKSCNLQRGELVARLDEAGAGFTVTADSLRVVDLGTAFGVRRRAVDDIQLEVFDGQISVYDTADRPMAAAAEAIGTLKQGQMATASLRNGSLSETFRVGASPSGEFVRDMPPGAARFHPRSERLAVDGFSRVGDGRPLAGVESGFGWTSAWRADTVAYSDAHVAGFAGQATSNNQGNAAVHRRLPWSLDKSRPVYASARFRIDGSDWICTAWIVLFQDARERGAGESNLMAFGISDRRFSARLASRTEDLTVLPAAKWSGDFGEYVPGEEHRLVAKLEFDVDRQMEKLSLWVDPSQDQLTSAPEPTHVVTRDTGRDRIDTIAVRFWEMDGDTRGYIDDIRVGPTWRSVVE